MRTLAFVRQPRAPGIRSRGRRGLGSARKRLILASLSYTDSTQMFHGIGVFDSVARGGDRDGVGGAPFACYPFVSLVMLYVHFAACLLVLCQIGVLNADAFSFLRSTPPRGACNSQLSCDGLTLGLRYPRSHFVYFSWIFLVSSVVTSHSNSASHGLLHGVVAATCSSSCASRWHITHSLKL